MSTTFPRVARFAAAVALMASPALAGDFFVSVNTGSDANDGLTPGTAWKTLTFALANVPLTDPTNLHTIHVAPGTYSDATGETFPLRSEGMLGGPTVADIEIVSDAGPSVTRVDGSSFATFQIFSFRDFVTSEFFRSRLVRIEGFHITAPTTAVRVSAGASVNTPVLRNLVLEGGPGTSFGLRLNAFADSFIGSSGNLAASVEDCEIYGWGSGVEVTASGDLLIFSSNTSTFDNVVIRDNNVHGMLVEGEDSSAFATLTDCQILRNSRGLNLSNFSFNGGGTRADATNTLIAENSGEGVFASSIDNIIVPEGNFDRCTIAINGEEGIRGLGPFMQLDVDSSIVWLNGGAGDIAGEFSSASVEFSDVGSSVVPLSGTNISTGPLFVDGLNSDYRLQAGSPCIDVGNPAAPLDPDGTIADMGAFPFDQGAAFTYCTGKTNSLGCVPFMSFTGFASTSAPQPFTLRADDVLPGEAGLVVYGFAKNNLNFHGGKLCVKAPLQRVLPVKIAKSTGAPPCTGVLTRNFQNRIQNGSDPQLTAGNSAFAQWRYRDGADPAGFNDGLTDAVGFTIAP